MFQNQIHPIIYEDIHDIASTNIDWSRFKNKSVLISGANGFLASYLVYTLLYLNESLNLDCTIIGISRNREFAEKKFRNFLKRKDFEIVIADVSNSFDINRKIDFVIHAASQASPKYYGIDPVGTLNANVLGTNNMLNIARTNKVESFLYFSSSEVYGMISEDKIPTKEDDYGYIDIRNVRSCYAESKRMGETMCISWMHQFGVPVKIVRPFHTYGPGMMLDDGRVYADFIADIVRNQNIVMKSDGMAKRAFCYLKDATEGFFRILLNGQTGMSYNLGNPGCEVSIIDLARRLTGLFPERKLSVIEKEPEQTGYLKSAVLRNCPDISKITGIGWHPLTNIETGFKRTIESYL